MMRVFIVDDEPFAIRRLNLALKDMLDVDIVGVAADGDDALNGIRRLKPDLAILDIELPGRNGIDVAAALEGEEGPEVVFLTAFDRYATEAFSVEATDYLLKPLRPDRLRQAIERARRRQSQREAARGKSADRIRAAQVAIDANFGDTKDLCINIPNRHGGLDLRQTEIVWIEAAKDYALIHTLIRSHILRTTMSELSGQLRPSIIRVHRSAFVALEAIQRWLRSSKGILTLVLVDGSNVQVGPSYNQSVMTMLRALRPHL